MVVIHRRSIRELARNKQLHNIVPLLVRPRIQPPLLQNLGANLCHLLDSPILCRIDGQKPKVAHGRECRGDRDVLERVLDEFDHAGVLGGHRVEGLAKGGFADGVDAGAV